MTQTDPGGGDERAPIRGGPGTNGSHSNNGDNNGASGYGVVGTDVPIKMTQEDERNL